jgi:hypothetical protein
VSQQGRVLLEADTNEGQRLVTEETRLDALDFVGPCGTPDNGYEVVASGADFTIKEGTMYVGGLRVTLEAGVLYSAQPDWLDTGELGPWAEGLWRSPASLIERNTEATLVLREQEITAVEDPALREVALGGPDTAARTRLLQRVVAADTRGETCDAAAGAVSVFWSDHGLVYDPATAALESRARLQVTPVADAAPPAPCDPPSASGYLGADNQMLRVQVTAFDAATGTGTLLWGYYNASTLYRCTVESASTVKLASRPVSAEYQPRSGQVVQVLARAADLGEGAFAAALTGHFAKLTVAYAPDTQIVTLPAVMPQPPFANAADVYLRLWEDQAAFTLGTSVVLGGTGLQVTLTRSSAGPLHIGDYWCFAARPMTPGIVYPERVVTTAQPPDGPRMWACPLAVLKGGGNALTVADDCRPPFDNLVELTARKADNCCCVKVTVRQAGDLQKIIDQAAANGVIKVVLHLEQGIYALPGPLLVTRKHKGLAIEACGGGPVVLKALNQENPDFAFGLILASRGAELKLKGLDFQLPVAKSEQATFKGMARQLKKRESVPGALCFGVRAVSCDTLEIEDCDFHFPDAENAYGAGVMVQGDTAALTVRDCGFFGASKAVTSIFTGVLAVPLLAPEKDGLPLPTSIDLCRIEDCRFAFVLAGVFLAGGIRSLWALGNIARSVNAAFFLASLPPTFRFSGGLKGAVPKARTKSLGAAAFASPEMEAVFSNGLVMTVPNQFRDTPGAKPYTLGERTFESESFPHGNVPGGQPLPSLCLTLQGNQFDCRPLAGEVESGSAVVLLDAGGEFTFANVTGNTVWNRSTELPAVVVLNLAGFNITANVLTNDVPEPGLNPSDRARTALWIEPGNGPRIVGEDALRKMMTVTGNTIFGRTNLHLLPRLEWPNAPAELKTWEIFNTVSS